MACQAPLLGHGRGRGAHVTEQLPDYSCVNLHSQQHVLVMCATAFYLMENYPLDVGPDFSASIIQVTAWHHPVGWPRPRGWPRREQWEPEGGP